MEPPAAGESLADGKVEEVEGEPKGLEGETGCDAKKDELLEGEEEAEVEEDVVLEDPQDVD